MKIKRESIYVALAWFLCSGSVHGGIYSDTICQACGGPESAEQVAVRLLKEELTPLSDIIATVKQEVIRLNNEMQELHNKSFTVSKKEMLSTLLADAHSALGKLIGTKKELSVEQKLTALLQAVKRAHIPLSSKDALKKSVTNDLREEKQLLIQLNMLIQQLNVMSKKDQLNK